jgi:hypothetical protein
VSGDPGNVHPGGTVLDHYEQIAEIGGVVDHGLDAKRPPALEVGLHPGLGEAEISGLSTVGPHSEHEKP